MSTGTLRATSAATLSILVALAVLLFSASALAAPRLSTSSPASLEEASTLTPNSVIVRPAAKNTLRTLSLDERRVIVRFSNIVIDPVAATDHFAKQYGFSPSYIYKAPIRGFAAILKQSTIDALSANPAVVRISEDGIVRTAAQTIPTGVRRMGATLNTTAAINGSPNSVDVDVAIIDTGVQSSHPDLFVYRKFDCTGNNLSSEDLIGHGTHVAGTIGALDNGIGVVGVAPGARLWVVNVFGPDEFATDSSYLCGLSWVYDFRTQIDVVNMSLGAEGSDGPCSGSDEHQAICNIVAAGVTIVVAAGNEASDANFSTPATYAEVITVSAIADHDGKIGGLGGTLYGEVDDTMADFSNYGSDVDFAAPGYNILSTYPTDLVPDYPFTSAGYAYLDGTSMASPHVAGAAALYLAANSTSTYRPTPSQVKTALRNNSDSVSIPGDMDSFRERTIYVGALAPSCTRTPTSGIVGVTITFTCTKFRANEKVTFVWDSIRTLGSGTAGNTGSVTKSFKIPTGVAGAHSIKVTGSTSKKFRTYSFTIKTSSLSVSSLDPGSGTTITLAGFTARAPIHVVATLDPAGTLLLDATVTASRSGMASVTVNVPAGATGTLRLVATDPDGHTVTVLIPLTAAPTPVPVKPTATPDQPTPAPIEPTPPPASPVAVA